LAEGEIDTFIEVAVARLDDIVEANAPMLIKIDVEGHESSVLRGSKVTLENPMVWAVIMETNGSGTRYGISDNELYKIMRGHGFSPYSYDPFERQLLVASTSDFNTIFIRDKLAVQERLRSARQFRLINGAI
jgi:hypothetical protein